ncbi:ABC-F family ATP-binding cassette domain-containing protein [Congregibacter litoralis]|uniref:Probable ATP-binding protein YheS n=1 Tax=Congregibacter litoralis KT71 TaxID=314285 RepID=A4A9G6_9GAMM|nr:ATP-binding cassette domain-containing protein [Congregibacter litoralis]EAQ97133.1 ATPase component of ABC transporter with duplicated ATPase domain protein [Congregibacter litoralis KT71]
MIILRDLSLRRADRLLFEEANASLLPGQKIALTGANGCGKSSLFAMLLGELQADRGEIEGLQGQRIAHMAQDVAASEEVAGDFVLGGDAAVAGLLKELQSAEARGDYTAAAALHSQLEACDGYAAERRALQLMLGLGFEDKDARRSVGEFSGGWRVRLALARALMMPSDLLLLDEPTNHLDLDTTLWLQNFLKAYRGTLLLISHDRDFIDASCSAVLHIEQQRLNSYKGGYSDFERQRALRLAEQRASAEKHARRRAEIEDFVRRFRAKATKAKQAQSRLKELARMGEMALAHEDSPFEFRFPEPPRGRDPLIELRGAQVGYDKTPLITGADFSLRNGDRMALLGRNGSGKTTFLRTLCGELPLLAGERHSSEGCRIAYFDQQQVDTLDLDSSALLHLQRITPDAREQTLRDFLGGFDFRGKRADAELRPFSGGEKARLALAILAWQQPNVLVLDEPTNHLDLEMRRALEIALLEFSGAVIVVSHDRHLLRSTADSLYRIAEGHLGLFDGDLDAYEALILRGSDEPKDSGPQRAEGADKQKTTVDRRDQRRAAAETRAQRRPLEQAIKKLEKRMASLENKLSEIETALADPSIYEQEHKAKLTELLREQGSYRSELEAVEGEWLTKQESLEAMTPGG